MTQLLPWIEHLINFIVSFAHCRDGRIKVIGGDNLEGLLVSPKQLPFKNLEVCISLNAFDIGI